jgi:transcriptional regulator with XRE-family HTH domain
MKDIHVNRRLIKQWRLRRGLSQRELAQKINGSPNTVNLIENEKVTPHPRTLRKIVEALGITIDDLIEEEALAS